MKRGRPPKKDKRNRVFRIRVNDEELELIKATAGYNGFTSISDFVRTCALERNTFEKLPLNACIGEYVSDH